MFRVEVVGQISRVLVMSVGVGIGAGCFRLGTKVGRKVDRMGRGSFWLAFPEATGPLVSLCNDRRRR